MSEAKYGVSGASINCNNFERKLGIQKYADVCGCNIKPQICFFFFSLLKKSNIFHIQNKKLRGDSLKKEYIFSLNLRNYL